jgi:N-acetylglutamate synthase
MTPAPDTVAAALASTWALVAGTLTDGWSRRYGSATALVTRVPVHTLNGAWAMRADTSYEDIDAALAAVVASDVPYCLEARPGCAAAEDVAARFEMFIGEDIPLMTTTTPAAGPEIDGLALRALEPGEARLHCDIAGPAFGAPPDLLAGVVTPAVLALPEVRAYVGEVDGEPVVTAMAIALNGGVGIFNVATPPEHRRRGYGAAATARALNDGLAGGAEYGWLQSTAIGHGIYERLGFETIERWPCWLSSSD